MRDHNYAFCDLVAQSFDCPGPVIEFGSYQVEGQEGYADLRGLFHGADYLGCDMRLGPGVDRVEDVTAIAMPDATAGTVLCLETFEHVFRVWDAFDEVRRILKPGGLFVLTSPFHFRIHGYPDDYWRMTPSCLRRMLEGFDVRVVGSQGAEKTPHTVMALAIKAPAPSDVSARIERLIEGYRRRLNDLRRERPWKTRLGERIGHLYRSKGERLQASHYFEARWTIDSSLTPVTAAVA